MFVLLGIGLPSIFVLAAVAAATTGQDAYLIVAAIALFGWIFSNSMYLYVNWPTGIRVDEDGVRIGNVRHPSANGRRPPAPSFQAYRLFSVPWQGVLSVRVERERGQLRQLTRTSRRASTRGVKQHGGLAVGFYLGMLTPPFMRAALVIEVDEKYATFPEFRIRQAAAVATSQVGTRSTTWVAPARHPERLAEAIETITHSSAWNARRMS